MRHLTRKHDPTSLHGVPWADSMPKHVVTSSSLFCHQITAPIQFRFVSGAPGSGRTAQGGGWPTLSLWSSIFTSWKFHFSC